MNHVMLDLETFGTKPGSVLRSIGAVTFNLEGQIGAEFYRNIDEASCIFRGLTKDPATVKWWSQQSPEAQAALLVDPRPLDDVVYAFHSWFRQHKGIKVWAQGSNFDPILWEAAAATGSGANTVPWKFYNTRDTRTAYEIGNFDPASIPRAGTYHNALDDCKHQVKCVAAAFANRSIQL
jgi:hypothetical protein